MNAKTFAMESRPSQPGQMPSYDIDSVQRSWFLKVCSSSSAILKWLSDTSCEDVLSVACITGADSSLDVNLDDD